jgi:molecular chaperone DnaK
VTPLSFGIETAGGVFTALIERNTTIPTKKSETFSTAADNQTAVDIMVYQGERPMAQQNKKIGDFRLDEIREAPRGQPQIEVTLDIDANAILTVTAKDKETGKVQHITIKPDSGLSDEEIERMVNEAKDNEASDKILKENIEAKNKAESLAFQIEKQLGELGDKVPADVKDSFDADIVEIKAACDANEYDKIKELSTAFEARLQELSQYMGAPEGDAGQAQADPAPEADKKKKEDDDVIDADFV